MPTFTAYPDQDGMVTGTSSIDTASTNIINGHSSASRDGFFRWASVTIAAGSTISSAVLSTYVYSGSGSGTLSLTIGMEDADNPATPTTASDANGRVLTTSTASFSGSRPSTGAYYNWPDFAGSVQEVIDRGGWTSGNAMLLFSRNNGSTTSNFTRYYSIEQTGTDNDPYITINYTEPANPARPFLRRRTRTFRRAF